MLWMLWDVVQQSFWLILRLLAVCICHVISAYSSKTEIKFVSVDRNKFRMGIIQTISYPCPELETWYPRPTPAHDYRADRRGQIFEIGCEDWENKIRKRSGRSFIILSDDLKGRDCKAASGWARSPLPWCFPVTRLRLPTFQPSNLTPRKFRTTISKSIRTRRNEAWKIFP